MVSLPYGEQATQPEKQLFSPFAAGYFSPTQKTTINFINHLLDRI